MVIQKPITAPFFRGTDWKSWDGRTHVFVEPWHGHFVTDTFDISIEVLPGFKTDFGSIPSFYRSRVRPNGPGMVAFLPHDCLYATEYDMGYGSSNYRKRADHDWLMLEMLQWVGFGWSRRNACYSAVRSGGGFVWKSHTTESIHEAKRLVKIEGGVKKRR